MVVRALPVGCRRLKPRSGTAQIQVAERSVQRKMRVPKIGERSVRPVGLWQWSQVASATASA